MKLATAFLLLHLKAHFGVLVDLTIHPVDNRLLVELYHPVEWNELFSRASFEVKVEKGLHDGTCGLYFFVTDLLEYWNDNWYNRANYDEQQYDHFEIFEVVRARSLRFFLFQPILVEAEHFVGDLNEKLEPFKENLGLWLFDLPGALFICLLSMQDRLFAEHWVSYILSYFSL